MAELTTVARPYAKAAFEFARDNGKLAVWEESLALLAALVRDRELAQYLSRPTLTATERADALLKAAGNLDAGVSNFVVAVADNGRLNTLPAIHALFVALKDELEQIAEVVVTTAYDLSDTQQATLASTLTQKLGRKVIIDAVKVDKSLIGGVIVRSGDLVIDASVRGKLNKLAATLNS